MHKVLLVEDSPEAYNLVKRAMGSAIQLDWAKSLGEAFQLIQRKSFDLILLDVMLPDGDGYRLCSMLQTDDGYKKVPIIFLTAKNAVTDRVMGFSLGAEDYISKPFDSIELKARVESRLRKRDRDKMEADILKPGDIEINKSTQKVQLFENGQAVDIDLTPIEFKLLLVLCREFNKVYSRSEILDSVWGKHIHVYTRSVDTHVSKLRKKLGSKSTYIESVHGTGYRFVVDEASRTGSIELRAHAMN